MSMLKSIVERIERLDEEEAAIKSDKRDVYAEAKSSGYDPKILREVIRRRKADPGALSERESLVEIYEAEIANAASPSRARDAGDARDAREGQSRITIPGSVVTGFQPTTQVDGVAGVRPEEASDDMGVRSPPARDSHAQSLEVSTDTTEGGEKDDAGTEAPPIPSPSGRQYVPTPVRPVEEIDLTIPAFLDRRQQARVLAD